jgi:hypothetical protein
MQNITLTSARTSFTIPKELMTKLDMVRGDIPRSRYLLRLIEKNLEGREQK